MPLIVAAYAALNKGITILHYFFSFLSLAFSKQNFNLNCIFHRFVVVENSSMTISLYNKTCVKRPLSKRPKIGFQDQLLLNAGQKYCRMLQD